MTDHEAHHDAVYIFATLVAAPGRGMALRLILEELATASRQEPGVQHYHLHEAAQAPGTFLVYEVYENQAAAEAHAASPHLNAALAAAGPLLGAPPVITTASLIS